MLADVCVNGGCLYTIHNSENAKRAVVISRCRAVCEVRSCSVDVRRPEYSISGDSLAPHRTSSAFRRPTGPSFYWPTDATQDNRYCSLPTDKLIANQSPASFQTSHKAPRPTHTAPGHYHLPRNWTATRHENNRWTLTSCGFL